MANDKTDHELIDEQGVNEGSQKQAEPPRGDVLGGGDLSQAPDRRQGLIGYQDQKTDEEIAGGPISPEPVPHRKDGTSNQDVGLMD